MSIKHDRTQSNLAGMYLVLVIRESKTAGLYGDESWETVFQLSLYALVNVGMFTLIVYMHSW